MFCPPRAIPRLCLLLALAAPAVAGCSASKGLTRALALALIRETKGFKEPATIPLKSSDQVVVPARSIDEPEQEAKARAVERFYESYPSMAVLRHLELIDAEATAIKRPQAVRGPEFPVRRPDGTVITTPPPRLPNGLEGWQFKVEPYLTEQGKQAAKGSHVDGGQALPLYRREVVEVTGVTSAQEGQAQAEFTWRVVPTAVGEAFDPASATFQSLPPELQRALREPQGVFGNTTATSFGQTNRSTATFRLYDEGWRVVDIR